MTNRKKYDKITVFNFLCDLIQLMRMVQMVLAIDIGNSNVTLGGFRGDILVFSANISTDTTATEDEYSIKILNILNLYGIDKNEINGAILASVVPQLNSVMINAVRFTLNIETLTVGPGIKTGISIQCDTPSSVGADLICASVAANFIYGSPALIIDLGTATKMTVVNKKGAFIGTSIMPGVAMGLNALANGTAQLPKVSLDAPDSVVAKNTADCMRSGIIYGNASMIDGMIARIKNEIGEELSVYITGGYASVILPYCNEKMTWDKDLVLKGLNLIYKKNV